MGDPRISDFMALLEVAKTNSFSSAAKSLKTSPVNLLNRINKLESYFQVEIFTRTNRGVFLTKEGERVLEVSKAIVSLLAAPQQCSASPGQGQTITIGASHIPGQYVLPCLVSNYQLSNPSVRFDLRMMPHETIIKQLGEGFIDLACFVRTGGRLQQDEIEIARDKIVVVAPPRHRLTRRRGSIVDALRQPLVLCEEGSESSDLVQYFLKRNGVNAEDLEVRLRIPEPEGVVTAVSEGVGLGLCPEIIARKSQRAGLVEIVQTEDGTYEPYSIIAKRGRKAEGGVESFWAYLSRTSSRFKGNLPCVLKMLYL